MAPIAATTGRISAYGTAPRSRRPRESGRRRDGSSPVPATAAVSWWTLLANEIRVRSLHVYAFRTDEMLSLADWAACWMLSLPVRIWASMLRRILPFSTLTQFLAVGTNQLRFAARSLTLEPSR